MTLINSTFVSDRIDECIAICETQQKHGFDNPDLFKKALNQGLSWLNNHRLCFQPYDASDIEERLFELMQSYLAYLVEQPQASNEKNNPVHEPAPSTQVQLFRLLGKETKFQSLYALNEQAPSPASIPEHCFWPLFSIGWRPSLTLTKRLFSTTRPVGGLGQ